MPSNDDVDLLVPEPERNEEMNLKLQSEEIKSIILKLGITQVVLGVVIIASGVFVMCTFPYPEADRFGVVVGCGTLVATCGALSISAKYHLYAVLVIISLIKNIFTSVLLVSGIIFVAVFFFDDADRFGMEFVMELVVYNMAMTASLVLCIYLAVVFAKVLAQDREGCCCLATQNPAAPNLMMVYVPPGTQPFIPEGGAHIAVPEHTATAEKPLMV